MTADREFIGDVWWQFLIENKIPFFIRIRENMKVHLAAKGEVRAFWLFNNLPLNTGYHYPKIVQIKGNWVYLSGMRFVNEKGIVQHLIVASYEQQAQALEFYKQRWQIETMFKAFKTAGFQLESTHLTDYGRLNKLLMLTALSFVWAYRVGIYQHQHGKPLKIKKHGRLEKSFFAYGLELLAQALLNDFDKLFTKLIAPFLSCT
ncbi:transposase [Cytophagaceae bacterium DM2B3-1]|uniref:Transposase n=1 Tax=Xanthocytophaga flava TaxID=3048013 RepID=A0ABT7CWV8_9BACT|nr:transposase [Xanthocytophaga flavus]MDJ1498255.1 transposase [Xanthocytophaga flavus]